MDTSGKSPDKRDTEEFDILRMRILLFTRRLFRSFFVASVLLFVLQSCTPDDPYLYDRAGFSKGRRPNVINGVNGNPNRGFVSSPPIVNPGAYYYYTPYAAPGFAPPRVSALSFSTRPCA